LQLLFRRRRYNAQLATNYWGTKNN